MSRRTVPGFTTFASNTRSGCGKLPQMGSMRLAVSLRRVSLQVRMRLHSCAALGTTRWFPRPARSSLLVVPRGRHWTKLGSAWQSPHVLKEGNLLMESACAPKGFVEKGDIACVRESTCKSGLQTGTFLSDRHFAKANVSFSQPFVSPISRSAVTTKNPKPPTHHN